MVKTAQISTEADSYTSEKISSAASVSLSSSFPPNYNADHFHPASHRYSSPTKEGGLSKTDK